MGILATLMLFMENFLKTPAQRLDIIRHRRDLQSAISPKTNSIRKTITSGTKKFFQKLQEKIAYFLPGFFGLIDLFSFNAGFLKPLNNKNIPAMATIAPPR